MNKTVSRHWRWAPQLIWLTIGHSQIHDLSIDMCNICLQLIVLEEFLNKDRDTHIVTYEQVKLAKYLIKDLNLLLNLLSHSKIIFWENINITNIKKFQCFKYIFTLFKKYMFKAFTHFMVIFWLFLHNNPLGCGQYGLRLLYILYWIYFKLKICVSFV